jgi:hypothetical protein
MRIGRAQYSRFGSTMHVRGVSSVWESAGFASRRSPVRSRYAPSLQSAPKICESAPFPGEALRRGANGREEDRPLFAGPSRHCYPADGYRGSRRSVARQFEQALVIATRRA